MSNRQSGNGSRLVPRGGGGGGGGARPPPKQTMTRGGGGGGGRRSNAIVVDDSDDDSAFAPPPAPAPAPAPALPDESLNDDLAEAVRLDLDPDFIEQLRMMSPRSRATILTDVRASQRTVAPPVVPPPVPARATARGGRARHGGRAHREEDWYANPRHYGDRRGDHFDDSDNDSWQDEDDDDMFPVPPQPAFMFAPRGRGGRGGGAPAMDHQMQLLHAFLSNQHQRGFAGPPRALQEMLAQAQRQMHQARAMGADLDVDNMSYEELLALEERMGHVSKGLSQEQRQSATEVIAAPSTPSPSKGADADQDSCVICMTEYSATPDNDCRRIRLCGHVFHDVCLSKWLDDNRRCPICNRDVL